MSPPNMVKMEPVGRCVCHRILCGLVKEGRRYRGEVDKVSKNEESISTDGKCVVQVGTRTGQRENKFQFIHIYGLYK